MNLYNPTSNDLYGYTGGNKMNRRDKIAQLIGHSTLSSNTMIADKILSLIDSEPTGLVKVRNCLWHLNHGLQACVKGYGLSRLPRYRLHPHPHDTEGSCGGDKVIFNRTRNISECSSQWLLYKVAFR